jgi:hypothetical protein
VGKVIKKIALPALAIGAAVLTGGAALGILPSVSSVLGAGGLGLSSGLTSVLATAGQGALLGAGTSLVTGGNILKGATTGFAIGGITGGIGQMLKPAASAAASFSGGSGSNALAGNIGADTLSGADDAITVMGRGASGIGSMLPNATAAALGGASQSLVSPTSSQPSTINSVVPTDIVKPAATVPSAAASAASPNGGLNGIGAFAEKNPFLVAGLLQGIGSGASAKAEAEAAAKLDASKYARIADNYSSGSFFTPGGATTVASPQPQQRAVWKIDAKTGELYRDVEAQ